MSSRFYATIAPRAGLRLAYEAPDRVRYRGDDFSFSLVCDPDGHNVEVVNHSL